MKEFLRKVFSPILDTFESGDDDYAYRPSHRTILIVVGVLFLVLSAVRWRQRWWQRCMVG